MTLELVECKNGHLHYRFSRHEHEAWFVRLTHFDMGMSGDCQVEKCSDVPSTWSVNLNAFSDETPYC